MSNPRTLLREAIHAAPAPCEFSEYQIEKRSVLLVIPMLVLWLLFGVANFYSGRHFTSDSVAYIQCADYIRNLNGFCHFDWRWGLPNEAVRMSLWPPGYPLAIAIFSTTGMPMPLGAQVVNFLGFTAALIIFLWVIIRALPAYLAIMIALAALSMRSVYVYSTFALSEGGFAFCAMASALLLVKGQESPHATTLKRHLAAGILAGISILFRYAGLSLAAASFIWLFVEMVRNKRVSPLLYWGIGLALGCGWFFAYNFLVFSRLIPYEMPPSTLTFSTNVAHARQSILGTLLPMRFAGARYWWATLIVIIVAMVTTYFWCITRGRPLRGRGPCITDSSILERVAIFAVLFLGIYFFQIVSARSKYEWGEIINSRHVAPVAWFFLFLAGFIVKFLLERVGKSKMWARATILTGLLLFSGQLVLHNALATLRTFARSDEPYIAESVKEMIESRSVSSVVLADGPSRIYLSIFGGLKVKYAPRISRREDVVTWVQIGEAVRSGQISCIVASELAAEDINSGNYGPVFFDILNRREIHPTWRIEKFGPFYVLRKATGVDLE